MTSHVNHSITAIELPVLPTIGVTDVCSRKESGLRKPANLFSKHIKILSIGDDPILLNSRQMVLESEGYEVVSIRSSTCLEDDVLRSFDLIILCHTISGNRAQIIQSIQAAHPRVAVLLLARASSWASTDDLDGTHPSPYMLLNAVNHIINNRNDAMKQT